MRALVLIAAATLVGGMAWLMLPVALAILAALMEAIP